MANIIQRLQDSPFAKHVRFESSLGETMCYFDKPQEIHAFLHFLQNDKRIPFQMLIDICGVHYQQNDKPFEVVYHLLSLTMNIRLRVIVQLAEHEEIHTVDGVYNSACWFERETFDMYGIVFTKSKDLRRILTDYGFEGYPLRKDFPLTGHVEVRYDAVKGEIVYEPINLKQDYRNFDFKSNWRGDE